MADNRSMYGFRWFRANNGHTMMPEPEEHLVASGASFDVSGGAQDVNLQPGDPVILAADGTVTLAAGAETSAVTPYGVVVGVKQYFDTVDNKIRFGSKLPSGVVWGTNYERASRVFVVPFHWGIWEIDADDNVTATTYAAYLALLNSNANYRLHGAVGELSATPRLDISTAATTNTLILRIVGVSPTLENSDFTGNYVKLLVKANLAQDPVFSSTGT